MAASSQPASVRFDDFEVDFCAHELRKGGQRIRLQEKPYQLLVLLLERPTEAVTRDTLRQRLWPSDTYVEFDDSLNHIVRRLREALGDTSGEPKYIETIPRFGYRFIGRVTVQPADGESPDTASAPRLAVAREVSPPAASAPILPRQDDGTPSSAPTPSRWKVRAAVAVVTLVVAASSLLLLARRGSPPSSAAPAQPIRTLAVLPFENLSRSDPEAELIAQGLTDTLITDLARLRSVRVVSRTTVVARAAQRGDARTIGRDLGVDALVEGTLLRAGGRLRVTAQLIDTRTDQHLWADRYQRDMTELLRLEDELVRAMATPLRAAVMGGPASGSSRGRIDPEAYVAYQRARALMHQPLPVAFLNAIGEFRRAISLQPDFAPAHAWLARTYARAVHGNKIAPGEAFTEVERAAQRALVLEPGLPEAVIALAVKRSLHDWKWAEARRLFEMAIPLSGGDPEAHVWYADFLAAVGQGDAAVRYAEEMRRLDPVAPGTPAITAYFNYLAGRHHAAIEQAQSVLDVQPGDPLAHLVYGLAALAISDVKAGRRHLEEWARIDPAARTYGGLIGNACARDGDRRCAMTSLRELEDLARTAYVGPTQFAIVYVALGDHDAAFRWLETAYETRDHDLAFAKVWPMLDPVRDDPRFHALLRRIGLS